MSKTFEYFVKTGEIRRPVNYGNGVEYEWDGDEGFEIYYEPDEERMQDEVVDLLFDFYFKENKHKFNIEQTIIIKEALKTFTDDNKNWDDLYDDFEDELKDIFEQEAFDNYE